MSKIRDRKTKKVSKGKSLAIGILTMLSVVFAVTAVGTTIVTSGKIGEEEIGSVATAAMFAGAFAGSFCCAKIGGKGKYGIITALIIVILRLILGAFSESELICSCTLSSCVAALLGGLIGVLPARGKKKRACA